MTKYKVLFQFIFLSTIILNSCSSSNKESMNEHKGGRLKISVISPNTGNRDSTIILSFYEILSKDTLKIEPINFNNGYEFKNRIKFSNFAWRANLNGIVLIEFEIDSTGRGNNVRVLSEIGGVGQSFAEAINQFKFDYWQNIYSEGYPLLLIAYINLISPAPKLPIEQVPK